MKHSFYAVVLACLMGLTGDQPRPDPEPPISFRCDPSRGEQLQLVPVPKFEYTWQAQRGCDFPDAEYVGFVIDLFYKKWKHEFGDKDNKIYKNLNTFMIEWGDELKWINAPIWSTKGEVVTGYVKGTILAPGYIWVWKERFQQLGATSLVHELVHSALWVQMGDHGDPDHEGNKFEGWTRKHTTFIREINTTLAQLGI